MELVVNFTLNNEELNAEFDISEIDNFDAVFQIDAAGTTWGSIDGTLSNQTDLQRALDLKANQSELDITNDTVSNLSNTVTDNYNTLDDKISDNTQNISDINTILSGYGDIVTHDVNEFATASQGTLADSALQPDDNISELTNNVGYITSSALDGYATESYVDTGIATKQNTLTAGANVQIVNNTISATDTTYTAGQGISIVNGTISNTQTSAEWGNIQGTLSNQTDLQNALNSKYNASNPNGYQANVIETIQVNGTTEPITNKTVNISVPTTATEIGALPSDTTIEDLTTTAQQAAIDSGATATNISQITTNENNISDIQDLIPIAATSSNQLADKSFVNSSIATNTANFIGTFNSVAELEAYTGTLTNNDYAFVETTDSAGNTLYDRYKYTDATNPPSWQFEYELNNSSFTANQWAAINSGITDTEVAQIATNTSDIATKQDIINDLSTIRSGASLGATSLQPNDNITELNNNAGYITGINSSDVITALGYTPYSDSNPNGYITGITGSDVTTALGYTPYNSTNPNGYITSSALSGYATEVWVGQQGYITGITSSDVTTALGYTPYNSSNPSGYISSVPTATTSSLGLVQPDGTTITINNGVISGASGVDIDNLSITENSSDQLQTVGVIDQNNTSNAIKTWTGTVSQVPATTDATTLYFKTDDVTNNGSIVNDLNGKADVDLTNTTPTSAFATAMNSAGIVTIVETWHSGTDWYRVYSDGWCEQGGFVPSVAQDYQVCQVVFHKPFVDTNYYFNPRYISTSWINAVIGVVSDTNRSTNSVYIWNFSTYTSGAHWYACGYIR